MRALLCLFCVFCQAFELWQTVFSQQIAHCQITQGFGSGALFVNENNASITEFMFANNFTFAIIPAPPSPKSNLNMMFVLVCIDLTSSMCSDYVGPCPRSVFVISTTQPFVSVINYQDASSKYTKLAYFLQFVAQQRR